MNKNKPKNYIQYRPTHKKHLFRARLKTLLPPRMQAQFLNSLFLIASQEYCTYFLFPPFLVSSAVISSYFLRQSLLFSSPFCGRYHTETTNFRCQYFSSSLCVVPLSPTLTLFEEPVGVESAVQVRVYRPHRQEAISCSHVQRHILLFLITGSTILIDFLLFRFLSFFF